MTGTQADRLRRLRLSDMAQAWTHLSPEVAAPGEATLHVLLEAQEQGRQGRRLARACLRARLPQAACLEETGTGGGLSPTVLDGWKSGTWLTQGHHMLFTGPVRTGKTWLLCALGNQALRAGRRVRYATLRGLVEERQAARDRKAEPAFWKEWTRQDVLIVDDFALTPLDAEALNLMLAVLTQRPKKARAQSLLVASPLPVPEWYERCADAVLLEHLADRLVARSQRLELSGVRSPRS